VQDEPVMRVHGELLRHHFHQFILDLFYGFARRKVRTV
jgi:hypothetical protein